MTFDDQQNGAAVEKLKLIPNCVTSNYIGLGAVLCEYLYVYLDVSRTLICRSSSR